MYVRRETLRQRKMYAKINIRLYMYICKIKMHQVSNYSRIEIIKRKIITLYVNWIIWDISSYPIILYSTFCYLDSIMQIFYVYEWRNYLGVQKESINCLVAKSLHMSGSLFWDVEKSFASIHVTFIYFDLNLCNIYKPMWRTSIACGFVHMYFHLYINYKYF